MNDCTAASATVVGNCVVLADSRQVLIDGKPARLGERAFALLMVLLRHRGRLVSKRDLQKSVWPGRVVEDSNLRAQVSALRKLLGQASLANVPGRGYWLTTSAEEPAQAARPAPGDAADSGGLIGRSRELAALCGLLDTHPLVTVLGCAGIGKSALARAAAGLVRRRRVEEVRWVDLGAFADPVLLPAEIARALGLPWRASEAEGRLAVLLRPRPMLLVLDNCERVAGSLAALVEELHLQAPRIQVLVTSQVPLQLSFERRMRLGPLEIPASSRLDDFRRSAVAMLFVDRARRLDPGFSLGARDARQVLDICRRLDGIPSAIETAAEFAALCGLAALRRRLKGGLCGDPALTRSRSMQAAFDWYMASASGHERSLFCRLGLFDGSFSLAAAAQVAPSGLDEWAVLELLANLVDKSMVEADGCGRAAGVEAGTEPRFSLLGPARDYARAHLHASGEWQQLRRRHAALSGDPARRRGKSPAASDLSCRASAP